MPAYLHWTSKAGFCQMKEWQVQSLHQVTAYPGSSQMPYIVSYYCYHPYLSVPPPVRHPHFVIYSVLPLFVFVHPQWCISQFISKGWIWDKPLDAFNRVLMPKLNILSSSISILVEFVSSNVECWADPFGSSRQGINSLKKSLAVMKWWTILIRSCFLNLQCVLLGEFLNYFVNA